MINRSVFYGGAIMRGTIERGEGYESLPHITLINLLEAKPLRPNDPEFHQPVTLMYTKGSREIATDILYLHNVELKKFRELKFDKDNALHRWLYFFCEGYKQQDAPELKEVLSMDAGLLEFADRYNLSIQDPDLWAKYIHQQKIEKDEVHFRELALEESREEGRAKGREEGQKEVVQNALWMGMDVKEIVQLTGLTGEQIKEIASENGLEIKATKPKKRDRER